MNDDARAAYAPIEEAAAASSSQRPGLLTEFARLEKELAIVGKYLGELEGRLHPILRPVDQEGGSGADRPEPSSQAMGLAGELTRTVRIYAARLQDLTERIDL